MEWILNRFGSLWCRHNLELVSLHLIFRLALVSGDWPDRVRSKVMIGDVIMGNELHTVCHFLMFIAFA